MSGHNVRLDIKRDVNDIVLPGGLTIPCHISGLDECLSLKIGMYKIIKARGKGSYSTVYHVIGSCKEQQGQEFALKVIDCRGERERIIEFFEEEVKQLKSLSHDNIVRLHDVFSVNCSHLCLLLELAKCSLADSLRVTRNQRGLHILPLAKEMCDALLYLRQVGVVHRDIQPSNILMDRLGKYFLADFGHSTSLSRSTSSDEEGLAATSQVGTLLYSAPELLRGGQHGFKVDVWSLGACLFECINGSPPFLATSVEEIFRLFSGACISESWTPGESFETKDFVQRMLTIDCNKRPSILTLKDHPFLHKEAKPNLLEDYQRPHTDTGNTDCLAAICEEIVMACDLVESSNGTVLRVLSFLRDATQLALELVEDTTCFEAVCSPWTSAMEAVLKLARSDVENELFYLIPYLYRDSQVFCIVSRFVSRLGAGPWYAKEGESLVKALTAGTRFCGVWLKTAAEEDDGEMIVSKSGVPSVEFVDLHQFLCSGLLELTQERKEQGITADLVSRREQPSCQCIPKHRTRELRLNLLKLTGQTWSILVRAFQESNRALPSITPFWSWLCESPAWCTFTTNAKETKENNGKGKNDAESPGILQKTLQLFCEAFIEDPYLEDPSLHMLSSLLQPQLRLSEEQLAYNADSPTMASERGEDLIHRARWAARNQAATKDLLRYIFAALASALSVSGRETGNAEEVLFLWLWAKGDVSSAPCRVGNKFALRLFAEFLRFDAGNLSQRGSPIVARVVADIQSHLRALGASRSSEFQEDAVSKLQVLYPLISDLVNLLGKIYPSHLVISSVHSCSPSPLIPNSFIGVLDSCIDVVSSFKNCSFADAKQHALLCLYALDSASHVITALVLRSDHENETMVLGIDPSLARAINRFLNLYEDVLDKLQTLFALPVRDLSELEKAVYKVEARTLGQRRKAMDFCMEFFNAALVLLHSLSLRRWAAYLWRSKTLSFVRKFARLFFLNPQVSPEGVLKFISVPCVLRLVQSLSICCEALPSVFEADGMEASRAQRDPSDTTCTLNIYSASQLDYAPENLRAAEGDTFCENEEAEAPLLRSRLEEVELRCSLIEWALQILLAGDEAGALGAQDIFPHMSPYDELPFLQSLYAENEFQFMMRVAEVPSELPWTFQRCVVAHQAVSVLLWASSEMAEENLGFSLASFIVNTSFQGPGGPSPLLVCLDLLRTAPGKSMFTSFRSGPGDGELLSRFASDVSISAAGLVFGCLMRSKDSLGDILPRLVNDCGVAALMNAGFQSLGRTLEPLLESDAKEEIEIQEGEELLIQFMWLASESVRMAPVATFQLMGMHSAWGSRLMPLVVRGQPTLPGRYYPSVTSECLCLEIQAVLRSPGFSMETKVKAMNLLGRLSQNDETSSEAYKSTLTADLIPLVIPFLKGKSVQERRNAAFALGNLAYHSDLLYEQIAPALPALGELLIAEDPRLFPNAAGIIANLCRNGSQLLTPILELKYHLPLLQRVVPILDILEVSSELTIITSLDVEAAEACQPTAATTNQPCDPFMESPTAPTTLRRGSSILVRGSSCSANKELCESPVHHDALTKPEFSGFCAEEISGLMDSLQSEKVQEGLRRLMKSLCFKVSICALLTIAGHKEGATELRAHGFNRVCSLIVLSCEAGVVAEEEAAALYGRCVEGLKDLSSL